MKLMILKMTDFFRQPGGPSVMTLLPGDPVTSTGNAKDLLIEIILATGDTGWVANADCGPDPTARPAADLNFFVDTCIGVERGFNEIPSTAPWFVAADFLIARALLETKIVNVGASPGSDAVGPLLVSSTEWQRFLAGADPALQVQRRPDGFDDWLTQIYAAGYTMSADAKAISDAVKKTMAGAGDDPFIPSYLNVLHAYFTNADTAAALLAAINDDSKRQDPVSKCFIGLTGDQIAQIFAKRGNYFGTALQPKTVSQFFDATGDALDQALKDAFDRIKQLAPDAVPDAKQSEAPWFDVALQQEAAHITAADNPDVIEKQYFAATDLGPQSTVLNWCAAFVSFCMKQSGSDEAAASIPDRSARAVSWGGWGAGLSVRAEDVPQGAVVVLAPAPDTNTTGHVGFCVQFLDNGKSIQLLGGNQSKRVQRSTFPASKIRAIRWLDLQPSNVRTGFQSDPADPKILISQQAIDLIVFFEVSSQALYEKKYRAPTWPGGRSGVTIGIGYDVGYAQESQLVSDWTGKIPAPMIDVLKGALGKTGSGAAALARQLRGTVDVPFQAAMSVFSDRDVPRWTKIVQSALPNCNLLSKDCLGALVSLAYNRGPSFSAAGSRYAEMRDIKSHMASRDFKLIPDDLRHMKRLWPTVPGLQTRREKEAQLFEQGLANMPIA